MKYSLAQFPFVRIAIPVIIGIALNEFGLGKASAICIAVLGFLSYFVLSVIKDPLVKYRYNKYYPIPLSFIFISLGWLCLEIQKPEEIEGGILNKPQIIVSEIRSISHENAITRLETKAVLDSNTINLLIDLQGNDYKIRIGDSLLCLAEVQRINPPVTPEGFNYEKYLRHNGILYKAYVRKGQYKIIGHKESLLSKSDAIRNTIIQSIFECQFKDNTANFLITILTGDKAFLTDTTKENFSKSGLAHILAVSGLHIAIISLMISWILSPLDNIHLKWLRLLLTLSCVWAFTFVTGMPLSAIRAAIMASFVIAGIMLRQKHSISNALFAAATFTLLITPSALFDVGFQMSYLSVFGIIIFADILTFGERFTLKKRITSIFAVSIAAQLGTAIVTLFYFNFLPLSFLIGNIIVVPLLPIFLTTSILVILLSSIGLKYSFIIDSIDFFYQFIEDIAKFSTSLESLTIEDFWIPGSTAICLCIAIFAIGIWLRQRELKQLIWFSSVSTIIGISLLIIDREQTGKSGLFISDDYESTNIVYFRNRQLYIINSKNDSLEISDYLQRNNRFLCKYDFKTTHYITKDTAIDNIIYKCPFLKIADKSFYFAEGNIKNNLPYPLDRKLNTIILTNNYYNSIEDIEDKFKFANIVLTNEVYDDKRTEYRLELAKCKAKVYDIPKGDVYFEKIN